MHSDYTAVEGKTTSRVPSFLDRYFLAAIICHTQLKSIITTALGECNSAEPKSSKSFTLMNLGQNVIECHCGDNGDNAPK